MKKTGAEMNKPLVWLGGEIKSPPMSREVRIEAGYLIRKLQRGELISLPQSRPLPGIGRHCNELRIPDKNMTWRVLYRIDNDAIIILEVFSKKTQKTPATAITVCKQRLSRYDRDAE